MQSKTCPQCGGVVVQRPQDNNKKFCSKECRTKYEYLKYRKDWQRKKQDQKASEPSENKKQCLICKRYYRQIGTHIWQRHGVSMREYKEEYGLDVKRGILPEDLRHIKAEHVFENGTVRNLDKGERYRFKKGQKDIGRYQRSPQTMERLKKQFINIKNKKHEKQ